MSDIYNTSITSLVHDSSGHLFVSYLLPQDFQFFQKGAFPIPGPSSVQEAENDLSLFEIEHSPIFDMSSKNFLLHWLFRHRLLSLPEGLKRSVILVLDSLL